VDELKQALANPAAVFAMPRDVVINPALSREQKIDVLRRWEHAARMLQARNEEIMADAPEELLSEILDSLHDLDYWPDLKLAGRANPPKTS
jgi:hypothetical protein